MPIAPTTSDTIASSRNRLSTSPATRSRAACGSTGAAAARFSGALGSERDRALHGDQLAGADLDLDDDTFGAIDAEVVGGGGAGDDRRPEEAAVAQRLVDDRRSP